MTDSLRNTWVTLKAFRFPILLAQVKTIPLRLFKLMFLYTNALTHPFEIVFKALVEIFFSETIQLFLNNSMKFINVLEIFPRSCTFIFRNSQKSPRLKSDEYGERPINLIHCASKYSIVCVMMHNKIIKTSMLLHLFSNI